MMARNMDIWDTLAKTDPGHTKKFVRSGGFKGTAVKPIYCDRKMTEQFGPCGTGWGMTAPQFNVVPVGEEIAVYCTVGMWHGNAENLIYGVGGDFVAKKQSKGLFADDEAFKKAYTDALGNAMKHLGMSADIHMGQHDDDKYVTALRREFDERPDETAGAGEIAAINAIDACKSRAEIIALLTRDQAAIKDLPNGGAQRVKDHAKARINKEFPQPKEVA